VTGSQPSCASWTWVRDELLVGHAALALASWPAQFTSVRPGEGVYCARSDQLKLIAETEAGQQPDPSTMKSDNLTSDDIIDGRQNLLRWAGNLTAAKQVAEQWQTARGDKSALPALRLGEIDFLAHLDNDAAAEFGLAARRWAMVDYRDALDFDLAELDRSTALFAAGRAAEAIPALRGMDTTATQDYAYENSSPVEDANAALEFASVSYYACEQLGDYESRAGELRAAAEDTRTPSTGCHSSRMAAVSGRRC
jgi:hypothetical protein